jgi:hypothetical protein
MSRDPPSSFGTRIMDLVGDLFLIAEQFVTEIRRWNSAPRSGTISIAGKASLPMTSPTAPTDIPDDDVPCVVEWRDRLGGVEPSDRTATTWTTEDLSGNDASSIVSVTPDPNNDEQGTVTFHQASGQFRVVATTQGANGEVRAQSADYNITPGAPSVGQITVQ